METQFRGVDFRKETQIFYEISPPVIEIVSARKRGLAKCYTEPMGLKDYNTRLHSNIISFGPLETYGKHGKHRKLKIWKTVENVVNYRKPGKLYRTPSELQKTAGSMETSDNRELQENCLAIICLGSNFARFKLSK